MRAIDMLASTGTICKPGRDAFVQRGAHRDNCVPTLSNFFESLFKRVDASRRRSLIVASRIAFVAYQRWLEPHMIRCHQPQLILSTRCMIIDPAIYSEIYSAALQRFSLEQKMSALRRLAGLPFRDLYVFLETPARVALERIHQRIAKLPGFERQPREPILQRLGARFAEALAVAGRMANFDLVRIETTHHDECTVAQLIVDAIRARLSAEEEVLACA